MQLKHILNQKKTFSQVPNNLTMNHYIQSVDTKNIYGETKYTINSDDQVKKTVKEIWFKDERFEFSQYDKQFPPIDQESVDILQQDASIKGQLTPVLAFNIETYCQEGTDYTDAKGLSRIVLVNELGQRVFDSQIKLKGQEHESKHKKQIQYLRQLAQTNAPEEDDVRKIFLNLINGRKLVSYQLNDKLKRFQIMNSIYTTLSNGEDRFYDVSQIFNLEQKTQVSMEMICGRYLNINFRKQKNLPRAFSEAKITMALYKKWKQLNEMSDDPYHQNPNYDFSQSQDPIKSVQEQTRDFQMVLTPVQQVESTKETKEFSDITQKFNNEQQSTPSPLNSQNFTFGSYDAILTSNKQQISKDSVQLKNKDHVEMNGQDLQKFIFEQVQMNIQKRMDSALVRL